MENLFFLCFFKLVDNDDENDDDDDMMMIMMLMLMVFSCRNILRQINKLNVRTVKLKENSMCNEQKIEREREKKKT